MNTTYRFRTQVSVDELEEVAASPLYGRCILQQKESGAWTLYTKDHCYQIEASNDSYVRTILCDGAACDIMDLLVQHWAPNVDKSVVDCTSQPLDQISSKERISEFIEPARDAELELFPSLSGVDETPALQEDGSFKDSTWATRERPVGTIVEFEGLPARFIAKTNDYWLEVNEVDRFGNKLVPEIYWIALFRERQGLLPTVASRLRASAGKTSVQVSRKIPYVDIQTYNREDSQWTIFAIRFPNEYDYSRHTRITKQLVVFIEKTGKTFAQDSVELLKPLECDRQILEILLKKLSPNWFEGAQKRERLDTTRTSYIYGEPLQHVRPAPPN